MLRQGLDVRIGQSLSMTPQLQQAIRMLQLSSIELQEEIQQALEENPLLQLSDDDYSPTEISAEKNADDEAVTEQLAPDSGNNLATEIPAEMNIDAEWSDTYDVRTPRATADTDNQSFLENQTGSTDNSLQDHLLWQVNMSHLSALDKHIAAVIIQSLDPAGYLPEELEEILHGLQDEHDPLLELDDVQAVLTFVQHLDPVGVAARNLRECLLLQLQQLKPQTTLHLKAIELVNKQLDLLEKRNYKEIARRLKISQNTLEAIISLLRTLQPKPGNAFASTANDYITPDVFVRKLHGQWFVTLNGKITPDISVNQTYAALADQVKDRTDKLYFKENLQQARWLIRSVESRNHTIINVAKAIVQRQQAFMQYGEQAMKPMILRDIAEELEMHESTISRVTTNKYIHTPRGVFEFKYFFSSQLETDTGNRCSSTAIRAMIKQLISGENPASPLSDNKLTELLKEQGINVARRTVAKYREAISIPPSHERRTMVANQETHSLAFSAD